MYSMVAKACATIPGWYLRMGQVIPVPNFILLVA